LATKFDSFLFLRPQKQEKKKINTFRAKGNERNIPWYCVIFAGVPTKFATCAVLRDVDAENIFYSRVACARFLPNFGHDDTKEKEW